jgi:hypothetical protein
MFGSDNPMFTAPVFENNIKLDQGCGGMHQTLVCGPSGLVDCHSTVNFNGGTVMRDTHYGQTRLTDFFNPATGNPLR